MDCSGWRSIRVIFPMWIPQCLMGCKLTPFPHEVFPPTYLPVLHWKRRNTLPSNPNSALAESVNQFTSHEEGRAVQMNDHTNTLCIYLFVS